VGFAETFPWLQVDERTHVDGFLGTRRCPPATPNRPARPDEFALDKTNNEIDLSAANDARLRDTLAKFFNAATEVRNKPIPRQDRKPTAGTRPGKKQTLANRESAGCNGYQGSDRGRISTTI
jgi:Lsr2